jgi:quercetin dioxygenase-like cupin family protein
MTHSHFSAEATGTPTAKGRYVKPELIEAVEYAPGLQFQPVLGEQMLANFVTFAPHSAAPMHVHEEEQIVIVVEGEFDFTLDGDTRTMRPGDVAVIPPWVPHGAITRDVGCREIDMFNPPRATLRDYAEQVAPGSIPPPPADGDSN